MRPSVYGGGFSVYGGAKRRRRRVVRKHSVVGGRKRVGARRRRMIGHGFFGDLWSGIKNVGRQAVGLAPALWRSGLVSKAASMIPGIGAPAGALVKSLGGRRRRLVRKTYPMALGARRRRRVGRALPLMARLHRSRVGTLGGRRRRRVRHSRLLP